MISLRCEANTANKSSTMPVASSNATGNSPPPSSRASCFAAQRGWTIGPCSRAGRHAGSFDRIGREYPCLTVKLLKWITLKSLSNRGRGISVATKSINTLRVFSKSAMEWPRFTS